MLAVVAEIVEQQGLQPNGLVLECTLHSVVRNGVLDFADGESVTQNTIGYSTLIKCLLNILVHARFVRQGRVVHDPA